MAGRKPKPTALKAQAGETRTERLNRNEPKYGKARKTPPDALQRRDERAVWNRLQPMLEKTGVLTSGDTDVLVMLCRLQAEADRATSGDDLIKLSKELRQLWAMFGLTPVDRARLKIEDPDKGGGDPLEKMLKSGPTGVVGGKRRTG